MSVGEQGHPPAAWPFNSPVEVGLRALAVLAASHPEQLALQRLVILDYLVVHSDDVPEGPPSLHPATPYRAGELGARRALLDDALRLYRSRGLVALRYRPDGLYYEATDLAATFLDVLGGSYMATLRSRAEWAAERYSDTGDEQLGAMVDDWVGEWGAEFTDTAVLPEELW